MDVKKRKRAIRALAIFLLFMYVCYVVAKGIYAYQMARVSTRNFGEGILTHNFELYGYVKQGQEYGVYVPSGLMVSTVYVLPGQIVSKGDVLFQIDTKDLNKLISEKQIEIAELKAQLEQAQGLSYTTYSDNSEYEIMVERATEDYDMAVMKGDLEISRKKEVLINAQNRLEEHKKTEPVLENSASGSDIDNQFVGYQTKLVELEQNVAMASQDLENAQINRNTIVLECKRLLEDAITRRDKANNTSGSDTSVDLKKAINMKISMRKEELEQLQAYGEAAGKVFATEEGYITDSFLSVGNRTMDGASMRYTKIQDKKVVETYLDNNVSKYLEVGDTVNLIVNKNGEEEKIETTVSFIESDGIANVAKLYIDKNDISIGQSVKIKFSKKTSNYNMCVASQAIYPVSDIKGYVYIIDERAGFLGKEYVARRVDVNILDATDKFTAIAPYDITIDTKVVVSSSKDLTDGQVVRIDDDN